MTTSIPNDTHRSRASVNAMSRATNVHTPNRHQLPRRVNMGRPPHHLPARSRARSVAVGRRARWPGEMTDKRSKQVVNPPLWALVAVSAIGLLTACTSTGSAADESLVDEYVELVALDSAERGHTEAQDRCLAEHVLASLGAEGLKRLMAVTQQLMEGQADEDEVEDYLFGNDGKTMAALWVGERECYREGP